MMAMGDPAAMGGDGAMGEPTGPNAAPLDPPAPEPDETPAGSRKNPEGGII